MMKYLHSKASFTCILILMYAIIANINAQSDCNEAMCQTICGKLYMNGTCRANECDCILGKCNVLIVKTCEYLCEKLQLKGECNADGYCICKAELSVCSPLDCEQQCMDDPRAKECAFVTPAFCLKYGPIRTCGCVCHVLGKKNKFSVTQKYHSIFPTIYDVIQI